LQSFDHFQTFIMSISDCLAARHAPENESAPQRAILISSLVGRYIRRSRLEYMKLDFADAVQLWNLFRAIFISSNNFDPPEYEDDDPKDFDEPYECGGQYSPDCIGLRST
jgi:hypothetical protein